MLSFIRQIMWNENANNMYISLLDINVVYMRWFYFNEQDYTDDSQCFDDSNKHMNSVFTPTLDTLHI